MTDEQQINWPCPREEAHAPHPRKHIGFQSEDGRGHIFSSPPTPDREHEVPVYAANGKATTNRDCPGVKAHPRTMIGREVALVGVEDAR